MKMHQLSKYQIEQLPSTHGEESRREGEPSGEILFIVDVSETAGGHGHQTFKNQGIFREPRIL